jgi:hyperosmotically inducible periplasmic protein
MPLGGIRGSNIKPGVKKAEGTFIANHERISRWLIRDRDGARQLLHGRTIPAKAPVMKMKLAVMAFLAAGSLLGSIAIAQDSDTDRSHAKSFVKDSAITTKIKSKLAAEHVSSLGRIHVDTDKDGMVWLSGSARSQAAIDKAVEIARGTEGVKDVKNDLVVKKDD